MTEQDSLEVIGYMLKSKIKVLVWLPLPFGSKWRGEGIAQTIENIVGHGSGLVEYHILCNKKISNELKEICQQWPNKDNVKIKNLGFSFFDKTSQEPVSFKEIKKNLNAHRLLARTKEKLSLLDKLLWSFSLLLRSLLFWAAKGESKYNLIWIPAPSTLFTGVFSANKVIVSFWDPFVFEYSAFSAQATLVFYFISRNLLRANKIVTQSYTNKNYLTSVLHFEENKSFFIPNGSPSYEKYITELDQNSSSTETILDYVASKLKAYDLNIFLSQYINISTLFRLLSKRKTNTKIIIISTQYRPYKGFETLFFLLDYIQKKYGEKYDFQFILTANNLPSPLKNRYAWIEEKIHCITKTPEYFHAILYYVSDLALHPSNAEGGLGSYPQYEAASLGIPCLSNIGRHMNELASYFKKDISPIISDFAKLEETSTKIITLLEDTHKKSENISLINETRIPWSKSALEYEKMFLETVHVK